MAGPSPPSSQSIPPSATQPGGAFAAILPVCDVQGACKVGEQLRVAVEALNIPNPRSSFAEHVTISIGLAASIPCQEDSPLALAEWADKSLHQAKRSGRNKVGRGSTPCGDISLASLATAEEPAVKKPTLLIVDDSPSELEFVAECLGPEFTILVAPDGQKALEVVAHRMPDLVLLDVVMPGMDGYEVCRRFKADPRLESIPIIFLTVLDQAIPEAQGLALGAVDYISKPANPELIQLRVRTHLRIKQLYERECALVKLLRTSLADVTELQGLLPMCAWCQKVRNDQGYWEGLAAYISNHTGTTWTHGICPDCQYKLLHDPTA